MSDKRNAMLSWKAEAEAQLSRLAKRLEPLQVRKEQLETKIRALETLLALEGEAGAQREGKRQGHSLADHAYSVLRAAAAEMHYRDIHRQLVDQGVETALGEDPTKNLRAHLARDSRFVNVRRGCYALADSGTGVSTDVDDSLTAGADQGGEEVDGRHDFDMDYDPFAEE